MSVSGATARLLRWITLASLMAVAVEALALRTLGSRENGALFVRIRGALFTRRENRASVFEEPPELLVRRGFLVDRPALIERTGVELVRMAGLADSLELIRQLPSDQDRAVALVHVLGSGRMRPDNGTCGSTWHLLEKLRLVRQAIGCCSDYVRVFLLLAPQVALTAREVSWELHTVAEFWDPRAGTWVLIDPQYAIRANADGRPLSLLEIRDRTRAGEPIAWEFFGRGERHMQSTSDSLFVRLYAHLHMRDYVLLFGNNVLTQSSAEAKLAALPKPVRQAVLLLERAQPRFLALRDEYNSSIDRARRTLRWLLVLDGAFLAVGLLTWPASTIVGRSQGRFGQDLVVAPDGEGV
ncbi:MAG: hypothetical protein ACHQU8_00080 [Gemmatimonadales bacterium]